MKSKKINAFTLIEVIICLIIISLFLYIVDISKSSYLRIAERIKVESIVDILNYTARVSLSTSSSSSIKILSNNKSLQIRYYKNNSKKVITLPEGLEFYKCTKHKDEYDIYGSMAPSLGGIIHIIGEYNNYDIIFPVAIARFRLVVKDKEKSICE